MNWRVKASIQNAVSRMPMSDLIYYQMQKRAGALKPNQTDPHEWFKAASQLLLIARQAGRTAHGKRFLEVGTGRRLNMPTALWLCGASEVVTVDLHSYLKEEVVFNVLKYIRENAEALKKCFADELRGKDFDERFDRLVKFEGDLNAYLKLTQTTYLSPADAGALTAADASFDFHVSHAVFEHIPKTDLQRIIKEGRRVLKPRGLMMHIIDPSDHFAHADDSISMINFLQFSEAEWLRIAGNKFMYHNRLRACELRALFEAEGGRIVFEKTAINERAVRELENGFVVDDKFKNFSTEELATVGITVVCEFD